MTLAELRGRVAVQLERSRQGRHRVWEHRAVTGCTRRDLCDTAHPGGVMVSPGQKRLPGRRAERCGVEPVVLETIRCEPLGDRCMTRPAEGAGRSEPDIVDENDQNIRRTLGGTDVADRQILRVGVLRIVGDETRFVRCRVSEGVSGLSCRRGPRSPPGVCFRSCGSLRRHTTSLVPGRSSTIQTIQGAGCAERLTQYTAHVEAHHAMSLAKKPVRKRERPSPCRGM